MVEKVAFFLMFCMSFELIVNVIFRVNVILECKIG